MFHFNDLRRDMNQVDPTGTASTTYYSQNQSPSREVYRQVSSTQPSEDQLTSHSAQSDIKITGFELVAKSAVAMTLGIVPFIVSKFGEFVVKGCANFAERTESLFGQQHILSNGSRMAIGIPAFFGGIFLFGGAVVFSRTQQVVWGKYLTEHPQEERVNTQLARYGFGSKPWNDFCKLLTAFFAPSFGLESVSTPLAQLRDFKATEF
jgi:hypothetical protein